MNDPDLQRWLLADDGIATRLRALRGTTPGNTFAAAAGMRPSKLSKLELAQQTPTDNDIRAIVAAADQPTQIADELIAKLATAPTVKASARINRFGQTAAQRRLNQLLTETSRIRLYESTHLPRPLQTLDYATAALAQAARIAGTSTDPTAATVLTEAGKLLNDHTRRFDIIIAEPVLYWQVLPALQMRHQLTRLIDAMALPNVDLRILPFSRAGVIPPATGFALTDSGGHTDTLEGATNLAGSRLKGHTAVMDDLVAAAVHGQEALTLIRAAVARTQSAAPVRFKAGADA